jgi:hypothetical protein
MSDLKKMFKTKGRGSGRQMSDTTFEAIRLLYAGEESCDIARKLNVSRQRIHQIKKKYVNTGDSSNNSQ